MFNIVAWDVPFEINGEKFTYEEEIPGEFETINDAVLAAKVWYSNKDFRWCTLPEPHEEFNKKTLYHYDLVSIYEYDCTEGSSGLIIEEYDINGYKRE